jgi:hypothetical protein
MSRWSQEPDTDDDNALSPEREEPNCETCGESANAAIWAGNG